MVAGTAAADSSRITLQALKMTAGLAVSKVKGVSAVTDVPEALLVREKAGTVEFRIKIDADYGTDLVRLSGLVQAAVRKSVEQSSSRIVSSVQVTVERIVPAAQPVRRKRK